MNTTFMLLSIYNKPRLTLSEVCNAIGISPQTAYNRRSCRDFPIHMSGNPLTADIRDVAEYMDKLRVKAGDTEK